MPSKREIFQHKYPLSARRSSLFLFSLPAFFLDSSYDTTTDSNRDIETDLPSLSIEHQLTLGSRQPQTAIFVLLVLLVSPSESTYQTDLTRSDLPSYVYVSAAVIYQELVEELVEPRLKTVWRDNQGNTKEMGWRKHICGILALQKILVFDRIFPLPLTHSSFMRFHTVYGLTHYPTSDDRWVIRSSILL